MSTDNTNEEKSFQSIFIGGIVDICSGEIMNYNNKNGSNKIENGSKKIIGLFRSRSNNDIEDIFPCLTQSDFNYGFMIGGENLSNHFGLELSQKLMTVQIEELKIDPNILIWSRILNTLLDSCLIGLLECIKSFLVGKLMGFIDNLTKTKINNEINSYDAEINQKLLSLYQSQNPDLSITNIFELISKWNEDSLEQVNQNLSNRISDTEKIEKISIEDIIKLVNGLYDMFTSDTLKDFYEQTFIKIDEFLESKMNKQMSVNHEQDYKDFESKVKLEWKFLIETRIVKNLEILIKGLLDGVALRIKYILKNFLYEIIKKIKEIPLRNIFNEIVKNENKEDYYKTLSILMAQTTDPKFHAEMLRKNAPCDMICVQAASNLLRREIVVKFPDEELIFSPTKETPIIIYGNHRASHTSSGHFSSLIDSESNHNESENNCLLSAIMENLSDDDYIDFSEEEFRESIAQHISDNESENISVMFENNWNRYFGSKGYFGGKPPKRKTEPEKAIRQKEKNHIVKCFEFKYNDNLLTKENKLKSYEQEIIDLINGLEAKLSIDSYHYVSHATLNEQTIFKSKNFRVDIQKSSENIDNYQIQINKESGDLYNKANKTSICGILINKPVEGEVYKIEWNYIKSAFVLANNHRVLINVVTKEQEKK